MNDGINDNISTINYIESITDCVVCFTNNASIKCKNNTCSCYICDECMASYLNVSQQDNNLPTCPNTTCNYLYLLSDIKHYPKLIQKYNDCCLLYLVNKYGNKTKKDIEIKDKIETIRNERFVFITQSFPAAIAYTAINLFPTRLKSLDKAIKSKLTADISTSNRICMNLLCDGRLIMNGEEYSCTKCSTIFCVLCEKKKRDNHVCKEEDVESLKVINTFIKCPKCKIPVIKSDGCDHMKCSNCSEVFYYSTGLAGGSGNLNNTKLPELRTKMSLITEYSDFLDTKYTGLITTLESFESRPVEITGIIKYLKLYYNNNHELSKENKRSLSSSFCKYMTNVYYNKIRSIIFNDIEGLIQNREITEDHLRNAIKVLQSIS